MAPSWKCLWLPAFDASESEWEWERRYGEVEEESLEVKEERAEEPTRVGDSHFCSQAVAPSSQPDADSDRHLRKEVQARIDTHR